MAFLILKSNIQSILNMTGFIGNYIYCKFSNLTPFPLVQSTFGIGILMLEVGDCLCVSFV